MMPLFDDTFQADDNRIKFKFHNIMDSTFKGEKVCTFGDSIINKESGEEIPLD